MKSTFSSSLKVRSPVLAIETCFPTVTPVLPVTVIVPALVIAPFLNVTPFVSAVISRLTSAALSKL